MDRQKTWQDEVQALSAHLRSKGWEINHYECNKDGTVTFSGIPGKVNCDCRFKFDICYCDGSCGV